MLYNLVNMLLLQADKLMPVCTAIGVFPLFKNENWEYAYRRGWLIIIKHN